MKTKTFIPALAVIIVGVFFLAFSTDSFAGLSLGPANAVKKRVTEYNDKVRDDRIQNKGEWLGAGGTVTGVVRRASGDSITNSGISIYVDGISKSNADYSGGSYSVGVTPGKQVKIKATRWANNGNVESIEYAVTAAKGQTITQDIYFPWNVQASSLKNNGQFEDAKLSAANSPYTVDGDFNCTGLCIDPGVTIKFSGSYRFQAYGTVYASGTASAPIVFTSGRTSPGTGDYSDVTLGGNSGNSIDSSVYLNYVKAEYGSYFTINGSTSSEVYNCTFSSTSSGSLSLGLNGTVKYCDFINTTGWTSVSISGTPKISYCNIKNQISINSSAGEGIAINKCNLTKNAAGASYVLENSANRDVDASDNWWGTANTVTISGYIGGTYKNKVNYSTPAPLTGAVTPCGPQ